jgi:hypothetical protein
MPSNKTIVMGSNGQLGTDLLRCFSENVVAVTPADLEITNENQRRRDGDLAGRSGRISEIDQLRPRV